MDDIYVLLGNINDGLAQQGLLRIEEACAARMISDFPVKETEHASRAVRTATTLSDFIPDDEA